MTDTEAPKWGREGFSAKWVKTPPDPFSEAGVWSPVARVVLLNLDFRADFVEFLADGFGLVLVHGLFEDLRYGLDEILRFLQPEAGDFADDLDDIDLLVGREAYERNVELGLLLDRRRRSGTAAAAAGHRHRHGCRRRHAELGFERLDELRQLEHADALDVIDHLLLIQIGHCCSS